jgi:indolepyruvate ferredoxin oxidoreductase alpha subunit
MTGMQPTPGIGIRADGSPGKIIPLERAIAGCGVDFMEVVDPYDLKKMGALLKQAAEYVEKPDGGVAVIIARHPCVIANRKEAIPKKVQVKVTDECLKCGFCLTRFECPALYHDQELDRTNINRQICADCGLCLQVCPKKAIVKA